MLETWGQFVARRPRTILAVWVVLFTVAGCFAFGAFGNQPVYDRLEAGNPYTPGESKTGADILADATDVGYPTMVTVDNVDATDPSVALAVLFIVDKHKPEITAINGVRSIRHPYMPELTSPHAPPEAQAIRQAQLASDGRGVLITVEVGTAEYAERVEQAKVIEQALQNVRTDLGSALPEAQVSVASTANLEHHLLNQVEIDIRQGELVALPVSLVVLVIVFGGFLAAGLPLVAAVASVLSALGVVLALSYWLPLHSTTMSLVSVLGLGLCIDYALLMGSRLREELRHQIEDYDLETHRVNLIKPMGRTLETAGRTVFFSGLTVAISLLGLAMFDGVVLRSMAAAGSAVVIVSVLVALTFTPALMALLGHRVIRPGVLTKVPGVRRVLSAVSDVETDSGFFSKLGRGVQRFPLLVTLLVTGLLVVLSFPALNIKLSNSDSKLLPPTDQYHMFYDNIQKRYPGAAWPYIQVVARTSPEQMASLAQQISTLDDVKSVIGPRAMQDNVSSIAVYPDTEFAHDDQAMALVRTISAIDTSYESYVTGQSAQIVAFEDMIAKGAPRAITVVVAAIMVLLFLMTGSIVIPIKAFIMNAISLGAGLGIIVWIFQYGHGEQLMNYTSVGAIESSIPPLLIALGFGLAMDYEVFLLARVKELHDSGLSNDEAVVVGLQRSGRIITSAALIMALVFGGFATGALVFLKQMGLGLALAVIIDATLVRMLLVPATMTLMGRWNWWSPRILHRFYERFAIQH